MKKNITILIPLLLITLSGCALNQSFRARKLLNKCSYTLKRIDLELMEFAPTVQLHTTQKRISLKNPSISELAPALADIKNGKFTIDISNLTFDAILDVNNPTAHEVIIDSLSLKSYLDSSFFATIDKKGYSTIPSRSTKEVVLNIAVPTAVPLEKLLTAETMQFSGTIWMNIEVIQGKFVTIPREVTFEKAIPREEINKRIDEEVQRVSNMLLQYIATKGTKEVNSFLKKFF